MTSVDYSDPTPLVELRDVGKRFGPTIALDSVTLSISAGRSHAIVGRNGAGKSTLVSILTGFNQPDDGTVWFGGRPAPEPDALDDWREVVACVYQHPMTVPELTVAENLFLNDYPSEGSWISWRRMKAEAREALEGWGLDVDINSRAGDLSVGNRHLVEIARALRARSKFVILDEPTAQLEYKEIQQLFEAMNRLQGKGVTFLFISHHLQEIYDVCADVSVFRDGRLIRTAPVEEMDQQTLVHLMVGDTLRASASEEAEIHSTPSQGHRVGAAPVLEVDKLTLEGACNETSFTIHADEIVGLAGLRGSGTLEVSRAISGMLDRPGGTVRIAGHDVAPGRVDLAIAAGLGYVPEDRHARGYCENLSTEENVTLSLSDTSNRWGVINGTKRRARAKSLIDEFQIVPLDPKFLTARMSGGNQQKSVVARASASAPAVLLLVSPTAGVDIASKEALFSAIRSTSAGVLLVSDELDELSICDRILVMFEGKIVTEFGRERTDHQLVTAMEGVEE